MERLCVYAQDVGRSYTIRTYGCQMNVHDSERMAGLLEAAGYARGAGPATPPTSSCSTPARCGRTPTTSSTATSGTCARRRTRSRACRSPWAAASPRRTAPRSCGGRPGSTSSSARTTSARCPVAAGARPAQRGGAGGDRRVAGGVPVHAARPARVGLRGLGVDLRRAATTPARSASCPRCAAPSATGVPVTCSPRSRRWRPRACCEVTLLGQNVNSYGVEFGDRGAFAQAAARLRRRRRAGAGAVHLAAPARLHLRRHRGDGGDPERLPAAAHAAAVRARTACCGDAPLLPVGALPRDPRRGARGDARRRDHHRHHRRVPRRDRGRLRGHPGRGARGAVRAARSRSSTRRGPAPRPRRCPTSCPRPSSRSATSGSSRCRRRSPGQQNRALEGRTVEVLVADGRGPQGRRHPAAVRPGPRRPAGALQRPGDAEAIRPGDVVEVAVTYGAPHHLVADGPLVSAPAARGRGTRRGAADAAGHRAGPARLRRAGAGAGNRGCGAGPWQAESGNAGRETGPSGAGRDAMNEVARGAGLS